MKEATVNMELGRFAAIFKLLGDKTRLTMVKMLDEQDCCVCEFVEVFQMSQPSVSQHLRKLRDAGLVKETRKGQWVFYSLNKDNSCFGLMQTILSELPSQVHHLEKLEKQGIRVTCN